MSKALFFLGFNKKGKDILEALREYEEEERKKEWPEQSVLMLITTTVPLFES